VISAWRSSWTLAATARSRVAWRSSAALTSSANSPARESHGGLSVAEPQFFSKYFNTTGVFEDGKHARVHVKPTKISSWDFRKLASP
jgi:hypothetical protein